MAELTRSGLSAELLSYPPLRAETPREYLHCARLVTPDELDQEFSRLSRFCEQVGCPEPSSPSDYFEEQTQQLHFQWEMHSEFASITVATKPGAPEAVLDEPISDYQDELSGHVVSAAWTRVWPDSGDVEERDRMILDQLGPKACGGTVCDGRASIWTTFDIDSRGLTQYVIVDNGMTVGRMSRLVRRITELDTYRMLAIRGLPLAKVLLDELVDAESRLANIVRDMRESNVESTNQTLLNRLMKLSAMLAARKSETAPLFGACRSYRGIVDQRIRRLNEHRIQGFQRCSVFLEDRLSPAMRTCNIAAVNKQIRQQLRLQTSVESLSVIAISYYMIGLLGLLVKAAGTNGVLKDPATWVAALVPIVLIAAYAAIKRRLPTAADQAPVYRKRISR